MNIAISHGATTMYSSPAPAEQLMVATIDGIVTLQKSGPGDWRTASSVLPGRHVHAIIEEPRSHTLLAGCWHDGLYASEDGGASWSPRNQNLPPSLRSIYSLTAVPVEGRTRLFAGTEPAHLMVSDDLGVNWQELTTFRNIPNVAQWRFAGEPFTGHAKHINFDASNPRIMYVCIEVGAFLKSTDGGETWTPLAVPHPDMHRSVIDPRNPSRIFTTGGGGLQLSLDAGSTWRQILSRESAIGQYPDQLMIRLTRPDTMVLGCAEFSPRSWLDGRYAGGAIAKSEDGGESWRQVRGGLPERTHGAIEAMCQVELPDGGAEYFFGTTDGEIWHGEDEGERWTLIATVAPVSKSIHMEMLTGNPTTPLVRPDGTPWLPKPQAASANL